MVFGVNETFAFLNKVRKNKNVNRAVGGLFEEIWPPVASTVGEAVKNRLSKPQIPVQDPLVVESLCNSESIQLIPPLSADVTARYLLDEALKANDPGLFISKNLILNLEPKKMSAQNSWCLPIPTNSNKTLLSFNNNILERSHKEDSHFSHIRKGAQSGSKVTEVIVRRLCPDFIQLQDIFNASFQRTVTREHENTNLLFGR